MSAIMLCAGWRLRPLDHLQWVVERLDGPREAGAGLAGERWRPQAYCRTRLGIQTALSRAGLRADPVLLAGLPEYFDPGNPFGSNEPTAQEPSPSKAAA
jgi:hypothetical protein